MSCPTLRGVPNDAQCSAVLLCSSLFGSSAAPRTSAALPSKPTKKHVGYMVGEAFKPSTVPRHTVEQGLRLEWASRTLFGLPCVHKPQPAMEKETQKRQRKMDSIISPFGALVRTSTSRTTSTLQRCNSSHTNRLQDPARIFDTCTQEVCVLLMEPNLA